MTAGVGLSLRGIAHAYSGRPVFNGIDLDIEPGQFVSFLGSSGTGKSTLLRLIAGLESPDGGTITPVGTPATGSPNIRLMFQEDRLLPWWTVLRNVQLGLTGHESQARALLAAVGLEGRETQWPSQLSGGQKQRVALARALIHRPDWLLLDEPFGALDAITRVTAQQLLERLWQESPRTVLLVTHDVEEALVLSDRIIVLGEGRILQDLTVDEARPRHRGDPRLAARKEELLNGLLP